MTIKNPRTQIVQANSYQENIIFMYFIIVGLESLSTLFTVATTKENVKREKFYADCFSSHETIISIFIILSAEQGTTAHGFSTT